MDKKILSIFILLIVVIAVTALYVSYNQSFQEQNEQDFTPDNTVDEEDISSEIDDVFLSEDDEIDIGEMV